MKRRILIKLLKFLTIELSKQLVKIDKKKIKPLKTLTNYGKKK